MIKDTDLEASTKNNAPCDMGYNPLRANISVEKRQKLENEMYMERTRADEIFYPCNNAVLTKVGVEVLRVINAHVKDENALIGKETARFPCERTIIELCAGDGQFLRRYPYWNLNAQRYIGIEIDESLVYAYYHPPHHFPKATMVQGDVLQIDAILKKLKGKINAPVFLILQNSLGTLKGDYQELLKTLRGLFNRYERASLIISLYRQNALYDWGLLSYWYGAEVNGWPYDKNSLKKGTFKSVTGYESKWWSDEEIEEIVSRIDSAKLVEEKITGVYWVGRFFAKV